jgi:hypothetical protein
MFTPAHLCFVLLSGMEPRADATPRAADIAPPDLDLNLDPFRISTPEIGALSFGSSLFENGPAGSVWLSPDSTLRTAGEADERFGFEDLGFSATLRREGFLFGGALDVHRAEEPLAPSQGPIESRLGALGLLERGPHSALGWALHGWKASITGEEDAGNRVLLGIGYGYEPSDDRGARGPLAFHLGLTYEFDFEGSDWGSLGGPPEARQVLLHPTLVFAPQPGLEFAAQASLPPAAGLADLLSEEGFRCSLGMNLAW